MRRKFIPRATASAWICAVRLPVATTTVSKKLVVGT
jgi:hypothetical protein